MTLTFDDHGPIARTHWTSTRKGLLSRNAFQFVSFNSFSSSYVFGSRNGYELSSWYFTFFALRTSHRWMKCYIMAYKGLLFDQYNLNFISFTSGTRIRKRLINFHCTFQATETVSHKNCYNIFRRNIDFFYRPKVNPMAWECFFDFIIFRSSLRKHTGQCDFLIDNNHFLIMGP